VLAHVEDGDLATVAEPFLHRRRGDRAGHDLDVSLRGLLRSANFIGLSRLSTDPCQGRVEPWRRELSDVLRTQGEEWVTSVACYP
jgi:hypothetical protein